MVELSLELEFLGTKKFSYVGMVARFTNTMSQHIHYQEPVRAFSTANQICVVRKYISRTWDSSKGQKNGCLWPRFRKKVYRHAIYQYKKELHSCIVLLTKKNSLLLHDENDHGHLQYASDGYLKMTMFVYGNQCVNITFYTTVLIKLANLSKNK